MSEIQLMQTDEVGLLQKQCQTITLNQNIDQGDLDQYDSQVQEEQITNMINKVLESNQDADDKHEFQAKKLVQASRSKSPSPFIDSGYNNIFAQDLPFSNDEDEFLYNMQQDENQQIFNQQLFQQSSWVYNEPSTQDYSFTKNNNQKNNTTTTNTTPNKLFFDSFNLDDPKYENENEDEDYQILRNEFDKNSKELFTYSQEKLNDLGIISQRLSLPSKPSDFKQRPQDSKQIINTNQIQLFSNENKENCKSSVNTSPNQESKKSAQIRLNSFNIVNRNQEQISNQQQNQNLYNMDMQNHQNQQQLQQQRCHSQSSFDSYLYSPYIPQQQYQQFQQAVAAAAQFQQQMHMQQLFHSVQNSPNILSQYHHQFQQQQQQIIQNQQQQQQQQQSQIMTQQFKDLSQNQINNSNNKNLNLTKQNSVHSLHEQNNMDNTEFQSFLMNLEQQSKDQIQSRIVQNRFSTSSDEEKEIIFAFIKPKVLGLINDVFGNYVVQKFIEKGTQNIQKYLFDLIQKNIYELTLHSYGCRVVQKILEVFQDNLQLQMAIVNELKPQISMCIKDQNGNHVIQKCFETIPSSNLNFIIDEVVLNIQTLAFHIYGCRVIQKVLEFAKQDKTQPILKFIMNNIIPLCECQYGNYIIQNILEKGPQNEKSQILETIKKQFVSLSNNKYASNVTEKAVQFSNNQFRNSIINMLIQQSQSNVNNGLVNLMKNPFGNYVIQKLFEFSDKQTKQMIFKKISNSESLAELKKSNYGKHVLNFIEKNMEDTFQEE